VTKPFQGSQWALEEVRRRGFCRSVALYSDVLIVACAFIAYTIAGYGWRFPNVLAVGGVLGGCLGVTAPCLLRPDWVRARYERRLHPQLYRPPTSM
jgi:hypothetical protein